MRPRAIIAVTAIAAASMAAGGSAAASAQASTTCTWGGTPVEHTGVVTLTKQGLTNTPSTEPLPFTATGPLAGGCSGTLTYRGYFAAGASCPTPDPFEARVFGLPGVVRAVGEGITVYAPALLYDRAGDVVGSENPQVLTAGTEEQNFGFMNCNSPEGFKEGNFSSVIELTG
jgi:hypothetical protein